MEKKIIKKKRTGSWQIIVRCLNKPTLIYSLVFFSLIAELVEHFTGSAEAMGSNSVQASIFFSI